MVRESIARAAGLFLCDAAGPPRSAECGGTEGDGELDGADTRMREREADYQRISKLRQELVRLDAAEQIAREVDEAVCIMLYDADQRLKHPGKREAAVAIYRNVIRLFPQSRWADVAREKLSNIQSLEGASS